MRKNKNFKRKMKSLRDTAGCLGVYLSLSAVEGGITYAGSLGTADFFSCASIGLIVPIGVAGLTYLMSAMNEPSTPDSDKFTKASSLIAFIALPLALGIVYRLTVANPAYKALFSSPVPFQTSKALTVPAAQSKGEKGFVIH